jgi:hypothetical protein
VVKDQAVVSQFRNITRASFCDFATVNAEKVSRASRLESFTVDVGELLSAGDGG